MAVQSKLEAMEDTFYLPVLMPEAMRRVLLCMLEVLDVTRCMLLCMVEVMEGELCCWGCWRCWR